VTLTGSIASFQTTTLAPGPHTITATYAPTTSNTAGSASAPIIVTASTNQLPVCTAASANPGSLWPPNHKLVPIAIKGVTDPDGSATGLKIVVTKIWQDESTMADGAGDTPIDGAIVNGAAQVRAERSGDGNGRLYQIFFTATDATGGSCDGSVLVGVPHDQSGGAVVDSGVRYDSLVTNGPIVAASLPNHSPIATFDVALTLKGVAVDIAVLANDSDPDGNPLTVTAVSSALHGTTSINANGSVKYTPAPGFAGIDGFTYTIGDGHGGTATGIAALSVGVHSDGDGCEHDEHHGGHHNDDDCDHDRDTRRR
jgi:hypothetical protein